MLTASQILSRLADLWRARVPVRLLPALELLLTTEHAALLAAIEGVPEDDEPVPSFAERHPAEPELHPKRAHALLAEIMPGEESGPQLRAALEAAGLATHDAHAHAAPPPLPYVLLDLPARRTGLASLLWRPVQDAEQRPGSKAHNLAVAAGTARLTALLRDLGFGVKPHTMGHAIEVFRRRRPRLPPPTPAPRLEAAVPLLSAEKRALRDRIQVLQARATELQSVVKLADERGQLAEIQDDLPTEEMFTWRTLDDLREIAERIDNDLSQLEAQVRAREEKARTERRAQTPPASHKECRTQCDLVMRRAIACGADAGVAIPSSSGPPRIIPARYCLVRASDVLASHDPTKGFVPTPGYPPGLQERRYEDKGSEQIAVLNIARNPRPEIIFSTNLTATDGTPIVTTDGVALGGNKRSMGIQLHYANGGHAYADYLRQVAGDFGFTAHEIDEIPVVDGDGPMVVRVVDLPTGEWRQAMRALNTGLTQALDSLTEGVAIGHQITPQALQVLAHALAEDEVDLTEFFRSPRSRPFVDALVSGGIITQTNASRLLDPGNLLSESGRELIKNALSGAAVPDARLLEAAGSELRTALARSAPYWLAAAAYGPPWDIRASLTNAVRDLVGFRSSGLRSLDAWRRQHAMFDPPATRDDPIGDRLVTVLDERRGPIQLSRMARAFAHEAAHYGGGQTSLLRTKTPLEVLSADPGGPRPGLFAEGMALHRLDERAASEVFPGRFLDELNEAELEQELLADPDYRRAREREADIARLAASPQVLFGVTKWPGTVLVHVDPSGVGWRATWFDPHQEPTGHVGPAAFATVLRDIIPLGIEAGDLRPLRLAELTEGMRFTPEEDRKARHIAASYERHGMDPTTAEHIGWATVQKQRHERREGMATTSGRKERALAAEFSERSAANVSDFYEDRIDYETFSERQRDLWKTIETAGPEVKRAVLADIRASLPSPPSPAPPRQIVSSRKAGPRSLRQDPAAGDHYMTRRALRPPPPSRSKVARGRPGLQVEPYSTGKDGRAFSENWAAARAIFDLMAPGEEAVSALIQGLENAGLDVHHPNEARHPVDALAVWVRPGTRSYLALVWGDEPALRTIEQAIADLGFPTKWEQFSDARPALRIGRRTPP